jgi:hypothetical protein
MVRKSRIGKQEGIFGRGGKAEKVFLKALAVWDPLVADKD